MEKRFGILRIRREPAIHLGQFFGPPRLRLGPERLPRSGPSHFEVNFVLTRGYTPSPALREKVASVASRKGEARKRPIL